MLAAPALGQRVRVLYRRSTGEWALWKDIRSWWVLWAILAAVAVAVFLLLLLGGRTVAAQLSDYTVDHPNPAGSGVSLLVGFGAGTAGAALAWGLSLPVLGNAFQPLTWAARFLLGQWEPHQARFVGWVQESDGDGGVRSYPLFSLGHGQDFFPAVTRQKRFAPGDLLTVYKSPKGRFSLEPEPLDYLLIPLQLLPVFFVGLFVLCLLVTAAFLLGTGVAGLAASL